MTAMHETRVGMSSGATPWLVAFAGEAGSGKGTLSRALGRRLRWPVVDKDDIKDILHGHTVAPNAGPLAYDAMFRACLKNSGRCRHILRGDT